MAEDLEMQGSDAGNNKDSEGPNETSTKGSFHGDLILAKKYQPSLRRRKVINLFQLLIIIKSVGLVTIILYFMITERNDGRVLLISIDPTVEFMVTNSDKMLVFDVSGIHVGANIVVSVSISWSGLRRHWHFTSLRVVICSARQTYGRRHDRNPQSRLLDLDHNPVDQIRLHCPSGWWSWRRWNFCSVFLSVQAYKLPKQTDHPKHKITIWCKHEFLHPRECNTV